MCLRKLGPKFNKVFYLAAHGMDVIWRGRQFHNVQLKTAVDDGRLDGIGLKDMLAG